MVSASEGQRTGHFQSLRLWGRKTEMDSRSGHTAKLRHFWERGGTKDTLERNEEWLEKRRTTHGEMNGEKRKERQKGPDIWTSGQSSSTSQRIYSSRGDMKCERVRHIERKRKEWRLNGSLHCWLMMKSMSDYSKESKEDTSPNASKRRVHHLLSSGRIKRWRGEGRDIIPKSPLPLKACYASSSWPLLPSWEDSLTLLVYLLVVIPHLLFLLPSSPSDSFMRLGK